MSIMTIRDIPEAKLNHQNVLVRVDFNVPLEGNQITNDNRIREAIPTIQYLRDRRARVILMSHLGRPKGQVVESLRMKPVGQHLQQLLGTAVLTLSDCQGEVVKQAIDNSDASVILLENTRFYAAEEKNEDTLSQALAALGNIYINDAFGTAHRAHASTAGVAKYLPAYAGLLMEKEIQALGQLLENPGHPFVALIGGAKVSSKIGVLENLMKKVDCLIIGGAMAHTFMAARGIDVGNSLVEPDYYETARHLIKQAEESHTQLLIPVDVVVADSTDATQASGTVRIGEDDFDNQMGVDIGPISIQNIAHALSDAQMVLWNGPMGVFENKAFAQGTTEVAQMVAKRTQKGCMSIVGGGDSVAAIEALNLQDSFSHISTGGGASLEFLEGKELPGIQVLKWK